MSFFDLEWIDFHPNVFLDVGSYNGAMALRFKTRFPDCRVVAIEASPRNFSNMAGNKRLQKAARANPLLHFIETGAAAGRDPSPLFKTSWYVSQYPDVKASGLNPLLHFQRIGRPEGRLPAPAAQ